MQPSHPFASRLSFFTGKGGVGKSTVVAALAIEAARQGRCPLVVELGHRASMQALFGVETIAHDPIEVVPGVFATNLDLDRSLEDYVQRNVRVKAIAKRITNSTSLQRFFATAPAVGEVLTLLRLEQLWAERWSPILVDLDATGHALMFLGLPHVFDGLVPSGPIRRLLDAFSDLLRDPTRSQLHLVTLPAQLPVQETLELYQRLRAEHDIPLGTLFVNRVRARALEARHLHTLDRCTATTAEAAQDLTLLRTAVAQDAEREAQLARLARISLPTVHLPLQPPGSTLAGLAELGRLAGAVS